MPDLLAWEADTTAIAGAVVPAVTCSTRRNPFLRPAIAWWTTFGVVSPVKASRIVLICQNVSRRVHSEENFAVFSLNRGRH